MPLSSLNTLHPRPGRLEKLSRCQGRVRGESWTRAPSQRVKLRHCRPALEPLPRFLPHRQRATGLTSAIMDGPRAARIVRALRPPTLVLNREASGARAGIAAHRPPRGKQRRQHSSTAEGSHGTGFVNTAQGAPRDHGGGSSNPARSGQSLPSINRPCGFRIGVPFSTRPAGYGIAINHPACDLRRPRAPSQ